MLREFAQESGEALGQAKQGAYLRAEEQQISTIERYTQMYPSPFGCRPIGTMLLIQSQGPEARQFDPSATTAVGTEVG